MSAIRQTLVAAGMLVLSACAVSALPAIAAKDTVMRAGPGPRYGVVMPMPRGTLMDAGVCGRGWCEVTTSGRSGYAPDRDLTKIRNPDMMPGVRPWMW